MYIIDPSGLSEVLLASSRTDFNSREKSDHDKLLCGPQIAAELFKFLKSSKFKANLVHVIGFAYVKFFSVTHPELYLARKCKA